MYIGEKKSINVFQSVQAHQKKVQSFWIDSLMTLLRWWKANCARTQPLLHQWNLFCPIFTSWKLTVLWNLRWAALARLPTLLPRPVATPRQELREEEKLGDLQKAREESTRIPNKDGRKVHHTIWPFVCRNKAPWRKTLTSSVFLRAEERWLSCPLIQRSPTFFPTTDCFHIRNHFTGSQWRCLFTAYPHILHREHLMSLNHLSE